MKRFYALIMFVVCTASAMAQDTVHVGDPWYLTKDVGPSDFANIYQRGNSSLGIDLQLYYGKDTGSILVYGVAVIQSNMLVEEDRAREAVTMTPTVMLFEQESYGNPPSVSFLDSANVFNLVKQCRFVYPVNGKDSVVFPSYEFYFDTPHGFTIPDDSLYVACYWPLERHNSLAQWVLDHRADGADYTGRYYGIYAEVPTGMTVEYWISLAGNIYEWMTSNPMFAEAYMWGGLFPIIGLRCTAPTLRLVGRGGDSVTVGWWQAEGGEAYELSLGTYGSDPDTGLLVTPADSVHTFTGLQSDTLYSIWVRKACRYTTEGYDTLVWSDWSRPLVCRTSVGVGEVYGGEGLHVAAQDGCVAVQGLSVGERAEVYDMKGNRVATLAADGRTAPLPQGVYLVRTTAGRARKAVLTR
jgi:hypothetical protein